MNLPKRHFLQLQLHKQNKHDIIYHRDRVFKVVHTIKILRSIENR